MCVYILFHNNTTLHYRVSLTCYPSNKESKYNLL